MGATGDIGRAIARRLGRDGWELQLAARDPAQLEAEAQDLRLRGISVSAHECDVLKDGGVSLIDALPTTPDVAVCTVGALGDQPDAERDSRAAERVMRTNYLGPALLMGALANRFEERGHGTLIGISSIAGERGRRSNYAYGSAKSGFTSFLSGLRSRLWRSGVQVGHCQARVRSNEDDGPLGAAGLAHGRAGGCRRSDCQGDQKAARRRFRRPLVATRGVRRASDTRIDLQAHAAVGARGMKNNPTYPHNRLQSLRRVDPVLPGILALALVAGLLVVIRTWEFGIGLSPDSVQYVSNARALGTDHGPDLRPTWPPLFVLVLAAPGVVGVDPIDAAAVLNPSILVCICLVSGLWFYRRTNSGLVSIVVTAALAFSIPLTRASSFVWTEPLFVLLTVCSLVLLDSHLRNDSLKVLLLAALFAALACLTRYAGIALLASAVLIVLSKPQVTLRKRVAQTLSYSVVAALPVCLWLLRNHLLSESFVGARTTGIWSFGENAERTVLTLGAWALPWGRRNQGLELLISGVPLLAVVGLALAWGWSSSRSRGVRETISCLNLSDPFVQILAVYAIVYFAFILMVSTAIRIDPINDRLLVPAFVPLVLLAGGRGGEVDRHVQE